MHIIRGVHIIKARNNALFVNNSLYVQSRGGPFEYLKLLCSSHTCIS